MEVKKMSDDCCSQTGNIMILPCSGGSNVGQTANQAAVELTREGFGKMYCLAGIGGALNSFVQSAKDVEEMIVIDGCDIACGRACLEKYKEKFAPIFPGISTCAVLPMIFIIISSQARFIIANYQWALLVILGIGTLYPLLTLISLLFSKFSSVDSGDGIALAYSGTAKNHAITIGLATTAFGGTLAVFPAAVAPVVQMPIMLGILKLSERIKQYLDVSPIHADK